VTTWTIWIPSAAGRVRTNAGIRHQINHKKLTKEQVTELPEIIFENNVKQKMQKNTDLDSNRVMDTTCSICIEEYKKGDNLRLLPRCNHCFHTECILTWLTEKNASCPLCKLSVLKEDEEPKEQETSNGNETSNQEQIQDVDVVASGSVERGEGVLHSQQGEGEDVGLPENNESVDPNNTNDAVVNERVDPGSSSMHSEALTKQEHQMREQEDLGEMENQGNTNMVESHPERHLSFEIMNNCDEKEEQLQMDENKTLDEFEESITDNHQADRTFDRASGLPQVDIEAQEYNNDDNYSNPSGDEKL